MKFETWLDVLKAPIKHGDVFHSVICSDMASIRVPLGYYDHEIELLANISNGRQVGGTPIILRGLRAAREQFQQYGRNSASKILLLITSGANRSVS